MSPTTPRFEAMPTVIIDKIIGYTISRTMPDYRINGSIERSMLHICHIWRYVALKRMFGWLFIDITNTSLPKPRYPNCGNLSVPIEHVQFGLVKNLSIHSLGWESVVSKDLSLMQPLFDDFCFTAATSLNLWLSGLRMYNFGDSTSTAAAAANFVMFLQRVKMLAPNARRVATVMQFSDRTQIDHAVFADISKGVAGLISGVPEIGHFHFCCHGVSLQLDPAQFTRITRLDYGYRPGQDYFANIVCQSSSILKYLSILNPSAAHLEQILYGTDSSIAYPSLEELSLSGTTESVEVRFEAEFVHFPSLRKLFVHGLYPFARSVLAKGDNVTLEQLGVSFQFLASGPSNTNNLGLLTTLLSSRFVNLQAFFGSLVYNPSDLETFIDESYDNTVQTFINSLHCYKSLRKLEFSGSYFSHAIPNGVLSYKGLDSLRILKIESIEVVISDVALILRKAPLLESLRCHLTHRRSIVYSLGTDQLRKYIETDIVSLKSKLVAVKITNTNEMNCTQIAKFLILLGIACPLLSSVVTMTIGYDVLRTKISSLLTTSPFDEYAEKCSRLATIVSK